jgi:hypothetical protein
MPLELTTYSEGNIDTLDTVYKKHTYWKWDWFKSGYVTAYNILNDMYEDDDKGVNQNFRVELDINHNGDEGDY